MKQIKRIDDTTVEIDGVKYAKTEPVKPEWPTSLYFAGRQLEYIKELAVDINMKDIFKLEKIASCLDAARAINGDWEPDWENDEQVKWCPYAFEGKINLIDYTDIDDRDHSFVWFPTQEACQHFIDHFGEIWLEAIG